MSKSNPLTTDEVNKYKLDTEILDALNSYKKSSNKDRKDINVLDYGCGRGRAVAKLLESSYQAYGVDLDSIPVNNGLAYFSQIGNKTENLLSLINQENKTVHPDNFFDFTCSNQVFEHVSNLEKTVKELARITKSGGYGFHVYPSKWCLMEGHLFLPFIHWLPKNRLRKCFLYIPISLGFGPKWPQLKDKSLAEKTEAYYQYLNNKTFYRSFKEVSRIFKNNGFTVKCVTIDNPKIKNHWLLKYFLKSSFTKKILSYLLTNFTMVFLEIKKTPKDLHK